MAKPFRGTINVDVTPVGPDWAPDGRSLRRTPRFAVHRLDDFRYSAMGASAGSPETPDLAASPSAASLHQLPDHGAALADPSCLMAGRHHATKGWPRSPRPPRDAPARTGTPRSSAPDRGGAGGAGVEYLHGRQVASDRRGRDEHGLAEGAVAGRARLERFYGLHGAEPNQSPTTTPGRRHGRSPAARSSARRWTSAVSHRRPRRRSTHGLHAGLNRPSRPSPT